MARRQDVQQYQRGSREEAGHRYSEKMKPASGVSLHVEGVFQ
jgi:hypothetical protein